MDKVKVIKGGHGRATVVKGDVEVFVNNTTRALLCIGGLDCGTIPIYGVNRVAAMVEFVDEMTVEDRNRLIDARIAALTAENAQKQAMIDENLSEMKNLALFKRNA